MNKIILQKSFVIAALACVILIALYMVSGVIDDRQKYRDAAVQSIEGSYAGPQTLIGPVLVRPYTQTTETTETDDKGIKKTSVRKEELTATSFPREVEYYITASCCPAERRHGPYRGRSLRATRPVEGPLRCSRSSDGRYSCVGRTLLSAFRDRCSRDYWKT